MAGDNFFCENIIIKKVLSCGGVIHFSRMPPGPGRRKHMKGVHVILELKAPSGSIKRVVTFRLKPGDLVMETIEEVCRREGINNGVILSCIGSLQGARFMNPERKPEHKAGYAYGEPIVLEGPVELVFASGLITHDGAGKLMLHIHASLSDPQGKGYGGHLIPGNKVLITVEVVMAEIEGIEMLRLYDDEIDLPSYMPRQK